MKAYVVWIYPDEHKWRADACIVGIYTNKNALANAVIAHKEDFRFYGNIDAKTIKSLILDGRISDIGRNADTGDIEIVDINNWKENGVIYF